jgi:hypothetical protein
MSTLLYYQNDFSSSDPSVLVLSERQTNSEKFLLDNYDLQYGKFSQLTMCHGVQLYRNHGNVINNLLLCTSFNNQLGVKKLYTFEYCE